MSTQPRMRIEDLMEHDYRYTAWHAAAIEYAFTMKHMIGNLPEYPRRSVQDPYAESLRGVFEDWSNARQENDFNAESETLVDLIQGALTLLIAYGVPVSALFMEMHDVRMAGYKHKPRTAEIMDAARRIPRNDYWRRKIQDGEGKSGGKGDVR